MNFNQDVINRANVKLASLTDTLRNAFESITGGQGTMNTPLATAGGTGLGAMAGGAAFGAPGAIGGGLLGGLLGYGGANAVNQQGAQQMGMDNALAGGLGQGFQMGSQMDEAQNQMIMQNSQDIGSLVQMLGGEQDMGMSPGMDQGMDPSMGQGMDPSMGQDFGMDPSMMGQAPGMDPSMGMSQDMGGGQPQEPLPGNFQQGGKKEKKDTEKDSSFKLAVLKRAADKIAKLA